MANQRKLTKSVSKPLQIFIASTADLSHNQRHRSEKFIKYFPKTYYKLKKMHFASFSWRY